MYFDDSFKIHAGKMENQSELKRPDLRVLSLYIGANIVREVTQNHPKFLNAAEMELLATGLKQIVALESGEVLESAFPANPVLRSNPWLFVIGNTLFFLKKDIPLFEAGSSELLNLQSVDLGIFFAKALAVDPTTAFDEFFKLTFNKFTQDTIWKKYLIPLKAMANSSSLDSILYTACNAAPDLISTMLKEATKVEPAPKTEVSKNHVITLGLCAAAILGQQKERPLEELIKEYDIMIALITGCKDGTKATGEMLITDKGIIHDITSATCDFLKQNNLLLSQTEEEELRRDVPKVLLGYARLCYEFSSGMLNQAACEQLTASLEVKSSGPSV